METSTATNEDPFKLNYVRTLRKFLLPLGAWPADIFGEHEPLFSRYHRTICPILTFIAFIGQANYIVQYFGTMDFFLMGHCFINTFFCLLTLVRVVIPSLKTYSKITKVYLKSFHLAHYTHKGTHYKESCDLVDKISRWLAIYFVSVSLFCGILYNLPPLIENLLSGAFSSDRSENVTLKLTVYFVYPGFHPEDYPIIATLICYYLSFICSVSINSTDLLLYAMLFQIYGHLEALLGDLAIMPRPRRETAGQKASQLMTVTADMFEEDENNSIHLRLVDCVEHHKTIANFTVDMSSFFGPVLGINYAFHLVCGCLMLLELSTGDRDAIISFGLLTLTMFSQLIQMSVIFEIVGTASEKLHSGVYGTPWECMDIRNRRTVWILLHRVREPIHVTAMGLTPVGVTTMTSVLKTTSSYFLFLSSKK